MQQSEDLFGNPPSRSPFQMLLALVLRWPIAVILAVVLVTVFFASGLPRLRFGTSLYDLVIEDLPETARYRAFKQAFDSDEIIRIVIRGRDIFEAETFSLIERMAHDTSGIKGVRRVISLPGIREKMDLTARWTLQEFADVIRPVDLFLHNLISEDRRSTIITLVLENQVSNKDVIKDIENIIARLPQDLTAYQIGMPLVSEALAEYTELDFKRLPFVTLSLIAILLVVLFRNAACLFLPLMTVILSQVWTFGLMARLGVPLSMLTMIVPVLLIAVGTAYCLHLCAEYLKCSQDVMSSREAVYLTFSRLTLPTVLAVVTTVIGLGSLMVNRITAIREFSLFSCLGILSLLIILLTLFPACLALFPLPGGAAKSGPSFDRPFQRFLGKVVSLNIKYRKVSFSIILLLAAFCLAGFFRMRVETNPVEYFRSSAPVSRHFHDIYRDLSGSFPINVVLAGDGEDYFEDLNNILEMARLQDFLKGLPGVDKTVSFADYLKLVNYASSNYEPESYALPEEPYELRMLINNFKTMLGEDTLRRFMSRDFRKTNVLMLTHISNSRGFIETRDRIMDEAKSSLPATMSCDVTGLGTVISASSHLLTGGQVKSLSLTLALIFLIMVLLFLSSKVGLVALLPNLFPIVVNFGLMGWLNVNLSVATSLIASIAIGLAVDDTIHYLFRYNKEFNRDLDKDRALTDTILSVGRPIIFTTLIISIGFSILMFSHFKPTALFGLMLVITMFSALIGDLVLLPSLMLHVELVTAWDMLKWIPTMGGMPLGVAHEIRQPLNAIKVGSDYLRMMLRQGRQVSEEQLGHVVHEISAQVDRASAIIERFIELGQGAELENEQVDLNRTIRETLDIIENEMRLENIVLNLKFEEGLPPVRGNRNRLARVIYNVLSNAREAIHEKERQAPGDGSAAIAIRTFREDKKVKASVRDSGIGIPPYLMDRIFEPFFTTRASGRGKGLGLAISRQIVKAYGGTIEVRSEERVGTTVTISFPADIP